MCALRYRGKLPILGTADAGPSTESSFGPGIEGATADTPQELALAGQSSDQAVESSASDM